ncbi:MAG: Ig-like domain-containing protein [Gemmatimonadetes bacterium]|nr:Ig-like domain-containing protein [Gemmatimonadota bacterium]
MILNVLAALLMLQQQQPEKLPQTQSVKREIARLVIHPTDRTMIAGDTLRLRVEALDAEGRSLPNLMVRFMAAGARFEGEVEPDGLVRSGSTGTIPVGVVALFPAGRPVAQRIEIKMVPGPAARVAIEPRVSRLVVGQRFYLHATAYSAAGDVRDDRIVWKSSAPAVVRVTDDGAISAVGAGRATITAAAGGANANLEVQVVPNTITTVELVPDRASVRQGDVIRFRFHARDAAGRSIDGLTPTWTFSPGRGTIDDDGAFVGYEAREYVVTANFGARSADAIVRLRHRDVRRPLTILGRVPRKLFSTEEVWVHPNGRVAYLGTGQGGDRMYAIDISDPTHPAVVDSIVANTRRVNDLMTTPDGKTLVFTREGAADRKNGIVIASLEDPLHPKPIAEFTQGVTAGVHSAFIYQQPKYGTHVYLTNDGTGAMHVVDIGDPYHPREVAQWRTPRADAGRTLHDIDVKDGLAYLSYWNDGLVILDVGNGMKGGSPSNPQLVSRYKYDLNELYRDVEAVGGPGFIRGTHTAWRYQNRVFIADEVFPARPPRGAKDAAAQRAYGRLQVIDVTDIEKPRAVAWYEPEFGGVHNVWVENDILYLGAYNGGFHAFDVSGELRGDLRAQGREIAHLYTADLDGYVPNAAMTWGVVVKDGIAYVNDMNNGLWIVRIEPRSELIP